MPLQLTNIICLFELKLSAGTERLTAKVRNQFGMNVRDKASHNLTLFTNSIRIYGHSTKRKTNSAYIKSIKSHIFHNKTFLQVEILISNSR